MPFSGKTLQLGNPILRFDAEMAEALQALVPGLATRNVVHTRGKNGVVPIRSKSKGTTGRSGKP